MDDSKTKLNAALKQAMINKDTLRRDVIRMALSEVKQVEVDERKTLSDEDVIAIVQREIKKRRESIEEAKRGGRADIVDQTTVEVGILEEFLPPQLSRDEIVVLAKDAITKSGATSPKDMGKAMGILMPQVKGRADGKLVNEVIRELLSS